jgi:DNA-directed RNA polymerase specialized sigma24 family protein
MDEQVQVEPRPTATSDQTVSHWISRLKEGDERASQKLWERCYRRLVELARRKLHPFPRRVADEEDVALDAFGSFCNGVAAGRFPRLDDRNDLWQILGVLAGWKSRDLKKREQAARRGGGRLRGESVFGDPALAGIDGVAGDEPTPELAALAAEECERLLGQLNDPVLRRVALLKMEGYANDEIAEQLGCVARTVERKLRYIRSLWAQECPV